MGFRVWGSGFMVSAFESMIQGLTIGCKRHGHVALSLADYKRAHEMYVIGCTQYS